MKVYNVQNLSTSESASTSWMKASAHQSLIYTSTYNTPHIHIYMKHALIWAVKSTHEPALIHDLRKNVNAEEKLYFSKAE